MDEIMKMYQELHDFIGAGEICQELYQNIVQTMQRIFDRIPTGSRIAIRGAGVHTQKLLEAVHIKDKNVIGIFDKNVDSGSIDGYQCCSSGELRRMRPDYIVISNFYYRDEIKKELLGFQKSIVIDIYCELSDCGLNLIEPFYMYKPGTCMALNFYYVNYMENQSNGLALRQFLQAALEQKDFVMISRVYEMNGGEQGKHLLLIETWNRAQDLLKLIGRKLQMRKQKDIIMFWTDAISYYELNQMPETMERSKKGCFFQRAYTNAPYTNATMKAMFNCSLPIDGYPDMEQMMDRANSRLLQFLENEGYKFQWLTDPTMDIGFGHIIEDPYYSNTIVWWHGIQSLLQQEKPCFYIFHFSAEGHLPVISPDLECAYIGADYCKKSPGTEKQRQNALAYLDQCLSLYNLMLGDKIQILFSDHGYWWTDEDLWSEPHLHAYCCAFGENIPQINVTQFFPYVNFEKFIKWIIRPCENNLEDVLTDEVLFQDTDLYNHFLISSYVNRGISKSVISYRGIINYQYKYVLNAIGDEFFYRVEDGRYVPAILTDDDLRAELKNKCGTSFLDIRKYDRFKYSGKLYESIYKAEPEHKPPLWYREKGTD